MPQPSLLPDSQTPAPSPAPDADGSPNPQPDDSGRPDWVPEAAWGDNGVDLEALGQHFSGYVPRSDDLPESDEAYQLPEIDGFDHEKAAASPILKALRKGAHANGVGQKAFEGIIADYVAEVQRVDTENYAAEVAKLGSNVESRLQTLSNWIGASLPGPQAEALRAMTVSAGAVQALEALMNRGATPRPRVDPPQAAQRKTRPEIEALMASKEYAGRPNERNPAVIAEVEAWFETEYKE